MLTIEKDDLDTSEASTIDIDDEDVAALIKGVEDLSAELYATIPDSVEVKGDDGLISTHSKASNIDRQKNNRTDLLEDRGGGNKNGLRFFSICALDISKTT